MLQAGTNFWDKAPSGPSGVPSFSVKAGTQTFTGAKTQVVWGTETFDRDANFASDTFVAPVTGDYEFSAQLANGTGVTVADIWLLTIERTGSATEAINSLVYVPVNTAGSAAVRCRARFALAIGDEVKAYMTRSSGAGNYVSINDGSCNTFAGARVL